VSAAPHGEAPTRVLTLDLPAVHAAARIGRHMVRRFARFDGVPDGEVDHLCLVVAELLSNAVDHGGGGAAMETTDLAAAVTMRLELKLGAGWWGLEVSDQGGGDPAEIEAFLAAEDDDAEPDLENERGRGFLLMRLMVDELKVARSADGRGLAVRVRRRHGGET
jgi:anti-sigma regulatory factor (Ser/Thr protein kinase)